MIDLTNMWEFSTFPSNFTSHTNVGMDRDNYSKFTSRRKGDTQQWVSSHSLVIFLCETVEVQGEETQLRGAKSPN